jgi:stage II sporulation protein R
MRFRVLANSNSKADQDLKLKVRDGVLKLIKSELTNAFNKDDTKNIILKNLKQITSRAQEVVKQNGFEYKVKSYICNDKFPTKVYCDLKFPSGYYDALKIIIGSGKGKNFCCGMFPPLCFIDLAKKTSPDNIKQCLKNVLPDEGYKFVTNNSDHIKFKFKFKVAEILDNYKNRYAKKNHKPKEIIL